MDLIGNLPVFMFLFSLKLDAMFETKNIVYLHFYRVKIVDIQKTVQ